MRDTQGSSSNLFENLRFIDDHYPDEPRGTITAIKTPQHSELLLGLTCKDIACRFGSNMASWASVHAWVYHKVALESDP